MLAAFFLGGLGAASVSSQSAAEIGQSWLRHVYPGRAIQIERQQPVIRDGQTLFYIFELSGGGWILVAANDASEPILGYGDTGGFEYPVTSPEARYWLETFEEQLLEAARRGTSNSAKLPLWNEIRAGNFARWEGTRDVSPLCSTTWNQDTFYNQLCPTDASGPGGHAYAGCVATAMGQVMKKWNHPVQGTISHSYVENNYGTLSANFGATTYNWASMPNSISSSNTAIATLLYHCGVGVDMDYGPTASSANVFTNDAMEVFFGYDPAAQWQWRSGYTDTNWMNLMKADLNAGRPIVYVGYNASYTTGHTFVMDGFSSGNYFHFNWGWGGLYNGNFLLNSLIPLTGYDFSYFQWAYYNLYPGLTISGTVLDSSSQPLAGVTIGLTNPLASVVTDANGVYSIAVPNGYTGMAAPSLYGYAFTPPLRNYSNITTNQTAQNYSGTSSSPPPINLTTTGITQVSATISWTEIGGASAWDFEIGPAGFTPGMGMGYLQTMVGQPYLVWGLLPGTPYDWYVRSNYFTYTSAWSLPASFTTLGTPPFPPTNLSTTGVTNTSATFSWTESGSATMWDIEYGPPGFTPGIGAGIVLGSVTNPYTRIGLFPGTPYDWYVRSQYGIFATGWSLPASFTTLNTPVTPPINLTTTGITNTGATLNWTETGNAFMWDVEYGPPGLVPGIGMGILLVGVGMPVPPNGGQFPIGGLIPGTPYRWFVRANYGAFTSAWAGPASFTTLLTPPVPPANLVTQAITTTSALLTWTEMGTATMWDYEFGPPGFLPGAGMALGGGTVGGPLSQCQLNALWPGTPYQWYVRSNYGSSTSLWSGPASFTTLTGLPYPWFENFEGGFVNLVNNPANNTPWTLNSTLTSQGLQSAHNAYQINNSNILVTSNNFSLFGCTWPILRFDQIAKTENNYDHAYVELSTDGGSTWFRLSQAEYMGSGNYTVPTQNNPEGPCFMSSSYTQWSGTTPDNSWWKTETFDLLNYQSSMSVMVRFRLKSDNSVNQYGWLLDNVQVKEFPPYELGVSVPSNAYVGSGASYDYRVRINNLGYQADTYTASITGGTGAWVYTLFEANGVTPLQPLIPIASLASYDFIVRVTAPSTGVPHLTVDTEGFTVTSVGSGQASSFLLSTTYLQGDNITDPFVINSLPFSHSLSTVNYKDDYGSYGNASGLVNLLDPITGYYSGTGTLGPSPDVVYRLNLSVPTMLSIDLLGSTYDTAVALVTAPGTAPADVLLINDDFYTAPNAFVSYVDTGCNAVPAGITYIIIGGYGTNKGNYTLNVVAAPIPTPPTVTVQINSSANTLTLSWTQNTVMRYNIYSDTNPFGSFSTVVATGLNASTYTISPIPAANTFYRVTEYFCYP